MGIDTSEKNPWLTKDRSETDVKRIDRSTSANIVVENPALGINVYKNVFSEEQREYIINVLESDLTGNGSNFSWQGAQVTESSEVLTKARDCVDFKIGHQCLGPKDENNSRLYSVHDISFNGVHHCVEDYGVYWGCVMKYYEVFNYVKYEGTGKHFAIHADHGPAYVTTISAVAYLNDDYVGGEIVFPRFNLRIKPEAGDIVVFPSTFIYEHSSEPIIEGNKYSIVVMTDYNDRGDLRYFDYTQEDNSKIIY